MRTLRGTLVSLRAMGVAGALAIGLTNAQAQQSNARIIQGTPPPPNTLLAYNPMWMPYFESGGGAAAGDSFGNAPPLPPEPPPDTIDDPNAENNWKDSQFWEHFINPIHSLGGPVSLTMYSADFAGINAAASHSTGYRFSDTAGLIAPGAVTPGYRAFNGGGGLQLTIDTSRYFDLPSNQSLWFGLSSNFDYDSARFQSSTQTPGGANANAGSMSGSAYAFTGSANYLINNWYWRSAASFDLSHENVTNNLVIPGANGVTNGGGYSLATTVGGIFPVINTIQLNPHDLVKAPPMGPGGYALFLDASGHYSYGQQHEHGFTDSSGFTYGAQDFSSNDLGARVKLLAVIPNRDFTWMPFVGASFDHELGLKYTVDFPAQAGLPADTLFLSPSINWWGAQLGLDILDRGGARFGVQAFYQASADTQTFGGSAFLRISFDELARPVDSGIRIASRAGMPVKAPPLPQAPAFWNWAGLYIGGHVGGGLNMAKLSDPFGTPISGDTVRSPGFLGGGQIGYNWQTPGSPWVFGVEADGSLMGSDGAATCYAVSAVAVAASCRVRPEATSTFTGRIGYALGPDGRTLVYGKGGLAWADDHVDMSLNGATIFKGSSSQSVSFWGGTVGIGVEHALTPAWSVKAEYDYLGLGSSNLTNLGSVSFSPANIGIILGSIPPGTSAIRQNLQELKLGLNYKWGADPWASGWNLRSPSNPTASLPVGWEVEGGGRYFGSWGQFAKDFGALKSLGLPSISDKSRLTYDGMQSHSGEFFARVEMPWNLFVKGYVGGGMTNSGKMTDEDFVVVLGALAGAYSNTISPAITGTLGYGAIDGGFDFLRGPGYKVGMFGGYFHLNQTMNAFGCTAVAFINCTPFPVPTSGAPVVTETDKWDAVRIGLAGETMLTDRIKISGEAAYLPWVRLASLDQHFVGNTGVLAEVFPASGKGSGVQLETLLSYYLTPQWSVGLGGRYWGMWTTPNGQLNCTFGPTFCGVTPTAPQYFRAQVEQLGAFVQTSYKFDWAGSAVATR